MLRGWLVIVAILVGLGSGVAAGADPLARDQRWEDGRRSLAKGEAAEAKRVFEALLRDYPEEADIHLFLGIALLRLRDPESAEAAVRRAIALEPKHIEARTLLGWIQSEVHGNYEAAAEEYKRVVELRPDSPEARNNLGVALKRKGELSRAAQAFTEALELRPDYSAALSNRGWVLADQGRWSEARRDFERALRYRPDDDGALFGLSQALRQARDYAGAQEALGRLIARSPNFVYWLEWGRVGLIRYYWLLLLITIALLLKGRYKSSRKEAHGG